MVMGYLPPDFGGLNRSIPEWSQSRQRRKRKSETSLSLRRELRSFDHELLSLRRLTETICPSPCSPFVASLSPPSDSFVPDEQGKLFSTSVDGLFCIFDTSGDINDNDHLVLVDSR
ncbi:unnamed protein product [Trifolium pratense]|uniref:Uncharacterized protein n=1 Tax=Trifolium pratense TaxID=57577 RepID=A0ACB0J2B8_TRIPR|nr:unnamed protein product [Trifolium pratense]